MMKKCLSIYEQVLRVSLERKMNRRTDPSSMNYALRLLFAIVGRILNRFTKDVFTTDDSMPTDVFNFLDVSQLNVILVYLLVV